MEKHLQIRNHMLHRIRTRQLRVGQKAPSDAELARQFNVNVTTANKAVAMLVFEGYLERRRGSGTYVSDPLAQPSPLIGFYLNLRVGTYFSHLLMGAQEEAAARGYALLCFQSHDEDSERFWQYVESTRLKGLIINRPFQKIRPNLPTLVLDTFTEDSSVDTVQIDHEAGGRLLAEHFIAMGHRHVAFVSQDSSRHDLMKRAAGFLAVYDEYGAGDSAQRLHSFSKDKHNLMSVLQRFLRTDHRITGIAFDSDHVAMHAVKLLQKLSKSVPKDISIAGFGHVMQVDSSPRLTTIEQHPIALGQMAAGVLIDRIEGRLDKRVNLVSAVELIPGETVADLIEPTRPIRRTSEKPRGSSPSVE